MPRETCTASFEFGAGDPADARDNAEVTVRATVPRRRPLRPSRPRRPNAAICLGLGQSGTANAVTPRGFEFGPRRRYRGPRKGGPVNPRHYIDLKENTRDLHPTY